MDRQALNLSLFDVDETTSDVKVRDTTISPVSTRDVAEFCKRYHYTETAGSALWRWGLWHGHTLLGVVAYNLPTRETCEMVFGKGHHDKVWHMGRLALADDAPANSESRLIGGSLRAIRDGHPGVWGVLTYAATDVGHVGYVYQATNAIYTGTGGHAHYYKDAKGLRRATYLGGKDVPLSRALAMGWTRHEGGPKYRYVYVLGSKSQRKERMKLLLLPSLPYPKAKRTSVTDDANA